MTRPCSACGKPIGTNVGTCPHCGQTHTSRQTKVVFWFVVALLALIALAVVFRAPAYR